MLSNCPIRGMCHLDEAKIIPSYSWMGHSVHLMHGIKGFVIPTKSFVKIGITKIFYNNKIFSPINNTFGCCSEVFGCSNKKFICCS